MLFPPKQELGFFLSDEVLAMYTAVPTKLLRRFQFWGFSIQNSPEFKTNNLVLDNKSLSSNTSIYLFKPHGLPATFL